MKEEMKKLVVVGDGMCGKTALLWAFKDDVFHDGYEPTVFDTYAVAINVNKVLVNLSLWDTAGQEDYDKLRPLSYPDSDVVLICYGVDNPESLVNVEEHWKPEIYHFLPRIPFVLVGNKKDLRNDEEVINKLSRLNKKPVTTEEGLEMSRVIGAKGFYECSSKTRDGVREVFEAAAKLSLKSNSRCTIL